MKAIVAFAKKYSKLLKSLFYILIIAGVIFVAHGQLQELSGAKMKEVLSSTPQTTLGGLILLGLLAFTATGLYDIFAAKHFGVDISLRKSLKIGWIAQAFNNFAGLGGLTGGTIRSRYYRREGADSKQALNATVSVWAANLLGLFVMLLATLPFAAKYDGKFLIVPILACLYIPIYFLAGRFHWKKIDLRNSAFGLQNVRQKLQMSTVSVAEWLAAAAFFWCCTSVFLGKPVSFLAAVFVYSTATLVGLLTFIPAGLGTFDLTVIAFFQHMGYDTSKLFLAIIVYRITYYAIPWVFATIYWMIEFTGHRINLHDEDRRHRIIIMMLAIGTAILGIICILDAFAPTLYSRVPLLRIIRPRGMTHSSRLASMMLGIMLIVLSRGIKQRITRVYYMTISVLILAAITSVARGFDVQSMALLLIFIFLLFLARGSFDREPLPFKWKTFIPALIFIIGVPLGVFAWRYIKIDTLYHAYPSGRPWTTVLVYTFLVSAIAGALTFSRSKAPHFKEQLKDDVEKYEKFLSDNEANGAFTHLYYLGDKEVFYSSDGKAALLYRPYRSTFLVLGDPIGQKYAFDNLFEEFAEYADSFSCGISVYEIHGEYLSSCANIGLSFVKIGEDATVDLATYSNVGNKGKVFRRMKNRMGEKGTNFEVHFPPFTRDFINDLKDVSDQWLGKRQEMAFSLGYFDENYIGRAPVAIIRGERIEGFATIMPMANGTASVDLMRIRPDAPGGTMDGIFVSLIEWARENGYKFFNLGMAPMSNTGNTRFSRTRERIVRLVYDFGDRIYNFKGLRSYKEKFKPNWDSRYLAYTRATTFGTTLFGLLDAIQQPDRSKGAIPLEYGSALTELKTLTDSDDAEKPAQKPEKEAKKSKSKVHKSKAGNPIQAIK
ncbi:bifunctional lysylphosphatidylglycerol flippase/synthetase MprF [Actinotignum urinale]|uniref:Phosphatidylglycerol lysyltransferase n=1 Tax=Actinotignum urinale TaxID=190146 RepID=A0ABU5G9A5_9ACTO|nr:bifunctional lysylphosphatidylglycerol flippase/synthetase MprF [Actinotignum urinale]MDY5133693.1 bifunctional lysylphosphatidylglycerol flippase/synthetase MprF [Actinotignum urinale]